MPSNDDTDVSSAAVLEVVAAHLKLAPADIPDGRSLPDLGISSFGIMRLVLALEEQFGMEFSDHDLRGLTTVPVSQLHDLIRQARDVAR